MANDEKDTAEKDSGKKENKSKLGIVIILVAVLLILAGGGFIAYKMFLAPAMTAQNEQMQDQEVNAEDPLGVTQKRPVEAGISYEIPAFIVNLADPAGVKYLKIALSFEVPATNKKIIPEIESRLPKIKDTIITVLTAKTFEEIATPQGKISLKQELLRRVNSVLTTGKIMELHLTDFVVQG